jgi:hyperosmotically inducible protein
MSTARALLYRDATKSLVQKEHSMRHLALITLIVVGIIGCDRPTTTKSTTASPDNTRVNVRDRHSNAKTPIDQDENKTDVDITANIRKKVVDTEMSVNAQNVKIITQDGTVTLRGPVKSAEEKKQIEDIASSVAGANRVVSQIEVE